MKNKSDVAFVKRLSERRHTRGMSQAQCAAMLGISQGHYSKMETRKARISLKLWSRLEDFLGDAKVEPPPSGEELQAATLNAIRDSAEFRGLISSCPQNA